MTKVLIWLFYTANGTGLVVTWITAVYMLILYCLKHSIGKLGTVFRDIFFCKLGGLLAMVAAWLLTYDETIGYEQIVQSSLLMAKLWLATGIFSVLFRLVAALINNKRKSTDLTTLGKISGRSILTGIIYLTVGFVTGTV